jgi:protein involved in polysaccharide export with SLBB domain
VAGFGALGCAPKNTDLLHFLREHEHKVSAIEYRLGIPDAIIIEAPRVPEIDGETQSIQPDGKINLRLLGEVKIVDMTTKEIGAKLEVLLSRYYVDPKVSVKVAAYQSKKYYVHGQATTGPRPYTGRDTLIDAVLASNVDYLSWTSHVKVVRPTHGETPVRTLEIDVKRMLNKGDWTSNILLEPDDVVYIPPTPLAWFGLRVRELIYPVGPAIDAYTAPASVRDAGDAYNEDYRSANARPVRRYR